MAISSTTSRTSYLGNNATAIYSYGCRIKASTDLLVTLRLVSTGVEATLTLTTDYTVDGVGNSTGNITLVNSSQAWLTGGFLLNTYRIIIRRVRPLKQSTSIRNLGPYYAATHEDQFDDAVMIAQQQQDHIDRSMKLPETFQTSDFDPTIPALLSGTASVCLITDPTGKFWAVGPTASAISGAQAAATAAAASAVSAGTAAAAIAALTALAATVTAMQLADGNYGFPPSSGSFTLNQAATALSTRTVDSNVNIFSYKLNVLQTGVRSIITFSVVYFASAWVLRTESTLNFGSAHGLTLSVATTSPTVFVLKIAEGGVSDGTLKLFTKDLQCG